MKSMDALGGDWPPDMEISTSVNDELLLELIYVKMALDLDSGVELPELKSAVNRVPSELSNGELAEIGHRWDQQWARLWSWREELDAVKSSTSEEAFFTLLMAAPRVVLPEWGQLDREEESQAQALFVVRHLHSLVTTRLYFGASVKVSRAERATAAALKVRRRSIVVS